MPQNAQTAAAIAARRARTAEMLQRVQSTVQRMRREKTPITYQAVARRAGFSRTFLYQNPGARALVAEAAAQMTGQRVHQQADQADQQEASWRERALNAEDALKTADADRGAHGADSRPGSGVDPRGDPAHHHREHHPQATGSATDPGQPGPGGAAAGGALEPALPGPPARRPRGATGRPIIRRWWRWRSSPLPTTGSGSGGSG